MQMTVLGQHEKTFEAAALHTQECGRCMTAILDKEGNPAEFEKVYGKVCDKGLALLVELSDAEAQMMDVKNIVPSWARRKRRK